MIAHFARLNTRAAFFALSDHITAASWPVAAPPPAATAPMLLLPHAASPRRTMGETLGSPSSPCESSAVAATPETAAAAARLQLEVASSRPSPSARRLSRTAAVGA